MASTAPDAAVQPEPEAQPAIADPEPTTQVSDVATAEAPRIKPLLMFYSAFPRCSDPKPVQIVTTSATGLEESHTDTICSAVDQADADEFPTLVEMEGYSHSEYRLGAPASVALFAEPAVGLEPLLRCMSPGVTFVTTDGRCEGNGKTSSVLGYVWADKPTDENVELICRFRITFVPTGDASDQNGRFKPGASRNFYRVLPCSTNEGGREAVLGYAKKI